MEANAKSAAVLYPCAGLSLFCTLSGNGRGSFTYNSRTFKVNGSTLYELFSDGTFAAIGDVGNDGGIVTFASNQGQQLAVCSAGNIYIYKMDTGSFLPAPQTLLTTAVRVDFCETYFLALLTNGEFQISAPLDGTSWPGAQFVRPQNFPDNATTAIVDHNEYWVWSPTRAMGYYVSGSSSIFDPIGSSAFMEDGSAAPNSVLRADNTYFWIDASERGGGIARRAAGVIPQRISNHAVEYQWSTYPTITDAVGYSFQDQGHTFIQWRFPSANGGRGTTWVYDVETQEFHERGYWDAANSIYWAHRSNTHTYNNTWGKHLVSDWYSGKIYDMSINYVDDNGDAIRRMRITPPISLEKKRIYHQRLELDLEAGLGTNSGQGQNPQMMLSWTNDMHSWTDEYMMACGKIGQYNHRVYLNRLGQARQRAYQISTTDPIPWRIIEAYLEASPGFPVTERITKQYASST